MRYRLIVAIHLPLLLLAGPQEEPAPFAYAITAVDRKPLPLDLPALRNVVRTAGPGATLSFVVDQRGRVDPGTVHRSPYPDSAGILWLRQRLAELRFRPAERRGRAVRTRVALGPARTDWVGGPYRAADFDAFELHDLQVIPEVVNRSEIRAFMERVYPRPLEEPETDGMVSAHFVVLPDGRVDGRTITILHADRDELVPPTAEVVARLRFRPGLREGRAVRVLLAMPIVWPPGR